MKKGLVSIITPMYNSEKYILETYESIKNQSYTNWEWIVIDDCSNDKSYEIVLQLKKEDSRIQLLKNRFNLKAAGSRNRGLDLANGEYITFIDSDDIWFNNFLEEQIKLLNKKKCSIVFSSYKRKSENLSQDFGDYIVPEIVTYKNLLKTNYLSCLTVLYKKSTYKNKRFIEGLKMHEDYVFWLELLENNIIAKGNKKILAVYRIRKSSSSRNKIKNLLYMFYIFHNIRKEKILKTCYYLVNYIYYGLKKNKKIMF